MNLKIYFKIYILLAIDIQNILDIQTLSVSTTLNDCIIIGLSQRNIKRFIKMSKFFPLLKPDVFVALMILRQN